MYKFIPLLILLSSCASDPIVDMRGVDRAKYEEDLSECRDYASQVNTGREAATHGAAGAVVGGLVGAAIGDRETAGRIAGVGAVTQSARGASKAENRKERVTFNCLRGRGYKVLG